MIPLTGPAGEPVDLRRTLRSHGVASLPPNEVAPDGRWLTTTLAIAGARARTCTVSAVGATSTRAAFVAGTAAEAVVRIHGRGVTSRIREAVEAEVRTILRLDADLAPFYAAVADDPELRWVAAGAGRMLQCPTVFEEVVKTVCTTNCAWGGTVRMVTALVQHLGEPAVGTGRRAFPTPLAMARADEAFYAHIVRAGYRGRYLRELALGVARGAVDLERLRDPAVADDEVEATLLALPGIGPYAAAHVMLMLGRHRALILDSWTRPTYTRLVGEEEVVADEVVRARFARYGDFAGLAHWLFLTRSWIDG